MNERIIELSLDLNCKTNGPVIHLTQFDKGVSIHLSASLDGAFFSLSGTTVVLKGIDARKGQVLLDCQVNADGTATATTLDSTFSEDGVAVCKFIISDTTKTYATQSFLVDVDDSLDAEIHDDRYSLLGKLIREILLMEERGGILVDEELDATSIHPVQNKVIVEVLSHLVEYVSGKTVDNAIETGKIYYTTVGSSKALIIPVSGTLSQVQFRLDRDGKIYSRRRSRLTTESPFPAWGSFVDISAGVDPEFIREIVLQYLKEHGIDLTGVERTENRVDEINAQSDDEHYPTAGAVYDYAAPKLGLNYLNNQLNQLTNEVNQKANASDIPDVTGKADKSDTYTKNEVDTKLSGKADNSDIPDISGKADKATTLGGYGITDAYTKVQMNFELAKKADVEDIPDISGKADKSTTLAGYGITDGETTANKSTSIDSSSSNTQYPTAKAVYDYGTSIYTSPIGLVIYGNKTFSLSSTDNSAVTQVFLPRTITSVDMQFFKSRYPNLGTIYIDNISDNVSVTGDTTGVNIYYKTDSMYSFATIMVQAISGLTTDTYTKSEVDTAIQTAVGTIETQLSQV